MSERLNSDYVYTGSVTFTNAVVLPSTGFTLSTTQQRHQHRRGHAQPNTTATTETRTLHVGYGTTGSVIAFQAGSIAACSGAATITIDLKKNGTTVLSSPITLDNANTARVVESATISAAAYVVGDYFEAVITVSASSGTLATGLYCEAVFEEDAR